MIKHFQNKEIANAYSFFLTKVLMCISYQVTKHQDKLILRYYLFHHCYIFIINAKLYFNQIY